jgi:hypothetical protein
MEKPSLIGRIVRTLNGLIAFAVLVTLFVWAANPASLPELELVQQRVTELLVRPRVVLGISSFVLLFLNVYCLVSCLGTARYQTHLRTETEDGEVSIAVNAVEDTLERAVEALAEISDASVDVLKETSDPEAEIHIRTTVTTFEKTKFKEVVDHVRSILKERWTEIIDTDSSETSPYFEIVMGGVSEQTAPGAEPRDTKTDQEQSDEDPYLSDTFSGPKYPVDEDEDTPTPGG